LIDAKRKECLVLAKIPFIFVQPLYQSSIAVHGMYNNMVKRYWWWSDKSP